MPDDLALQIEPLHAVVRAHGWPLLMVEGVEADDVIGTLLRRHPRRESTRSFPLRTRTSRSSCVRRHSGQHDEQEKLDDPGVVNKFSVRADQVLDLLTLTGDAVDNVPGVPKVGPKTAASGQPVRQSRRDHCTRRFRRSG
jgi:DNA polymerase-1